MWSDSVVVASFLLLFGLVDIGLSYRYKPKQLRCERISIPMCADMRYNLTQMPNLLGHTSQKEAAIQVHEFIPLVQIGCSRLLKFFLCSQYAPMCTEQVDETMVIPPCRSLCQEVKASCEPVLMRFNFHWPAALDCGQLPEKSDRIDLCIEPPKEGELAEEDDPLQSMNSAEGNEYRAHWNRLLEMERMRGVPQSSSTMSSEGDLGGQHPAASLCPSRYIYVEKPPRALQTQGQSCAPRCDVDVLFRREDKRFMETWITIWSALSLTSSAFTVLTFLIDLSRFQYPERPIIFVSLCCTFYSLAYVIRVFAGSQAVSCETSNLFPDSFYRIDGGLESVWCTLVFILLYYFGMAACAWWVILTITWYLAAWRKWGGEAIAGLGNVFHLVAWSLPAIKTIVILALRRVDGEELTGLCYVGSRDDRAMAAFLLAPMAVYLVVGIGFTAAGFVAVCRIRLDLKKDGANIGKLEKLMAKMGIFSVLYAVPGICVFGCLIYEYKNLAEWHRESLARPCVKTSEANWSGDCPLGTSIPAAEIYLVKVFMSLVIGITSGMWIWSCKTIASWRDFLWTTFHCGRRMSPSVRRSREARAGWKGQGHGAEGVEKHGPNAIFPMQQFPNSKVPASSSSHYQGRVALFPGQPLNAVATTHEL